MHPLFIERRPGVAGRVFAVLHWPPGPPRGLVVHAHAFAEEMNKSRRMVALQARALACAGHAVLVPDLSGCGDSEDDFSGATWDGWIEDLVLACRWLRRHARDATPAQVGADTSEHGDPPLAIWGHRAGALLAAQVAARLADVSQLLLWQPTPAGKAVLQQFLRLATVGDLLGGQAASGTAALRQRLLGGETVEVVGYAVNPALALGLDAARLEPVAGVRRLTWLECSPREGATLTPAASAALQAWRSAGCDVNAEVVQGPAFWQSTEIEDAPALLQATLHALSAPHSA